MYQKAVGIYCLRLKCQEMYEKYNFIYIVCDDSFPRNFSSKRNQYITKIKYIIEA